MRKYGWIKDSLDARDYKFRVKAPVTLPAVVDLRNNASPIEDQSQIGSCTANAAAGIMEYLQLKNNKPLTDLSRLFIYYNTRLMQGTKDYDSGATIRTTIKSIVKYGACKETYWPYNINKYKSKPTQIAYKDGLKRQALTYQRLYTLNDMKSCLASGYPFEFGFSVYSSFDKIDKSGMMPYPDVKNEELEGGHAVCAFGYNDMNHTFIIRNSWGTDWGDQGYFYMPDTFISDPDMANDFWVVYTEEL